MSTLHAPEPTASRAVPPVRRRGPVAGQHAPTPEPGCTRPEPAAGSARAFLAWYARTLAVLLVGTAALLLGWNTVSAGDWTASRPWLMAAAATGIWSVAVTIWLLRQGWHRGVVHTVTWAAPAVLLLPLIGAGWISPAGLVLWGPVATVLAAALVMTVDPMAGDGSCELS